MPNMIACPDPTCRAPARIVDRWTWGSTSGPVEHVKTGCERGHWFTPTVDLPDPACPRPARGITVIEADNTIVRRLVDEVSNGGHLEVIDELYAPGLAGAARQWIAPFRASFPDVHMELVERVGEGDKSERTYPADAGTGPDAPTRCGIGSVV